MPADLLPRTESINLLQSFATSWRTRINTWHSEHRTGTESSFAQSFWSDLLKCFGIIAERIDLFEREAQRTSTGRHGSIDFFMPGMVIGEAKSLCQPSQQARVLDAAETQLRDYLNGIAQTEFPKYGIVTCFEQLRILRLDGTAEPVTITIDDLPHHYDTLRFFLGQEVVSKKDEQEASLAAAQLMADLYTAILGDEADEDPLSEADPDEDCVTLADQRAYSTSVLMTRLLFLMYGDDAGLWEADLFYRWVDQTTTADSLSGQLSDLFRVLNTPESKRSRSTPDLAARFPYVNGGIFEDTILVDYFTPPTRDALLAACRFRWTRISVTVFGALFQLVKSKEARRKGGEHYTSEKNILKTIGPMFLDEYERRATALINSKDTKIDRREANLKAFLNEIASNIYVDPACGGGNFLNLAYARLRDIETRILMELAHLDDQKRTGASTLSMDISLDQRLTIDSFYGFEIAWWPAKIAETSMFLVDHQANLKLAAAIGQSPERLPITITAHITHGNALAFDWSTVLPKPTGQTYVFGNPPFSGQPNKTAEQTADMKRVWGKRYDGYLDYVTGWHAQSLDLFKTRSGEFAYVSTNSITQGRPVPALFDAIFDDGWKVKFAHRTFAWDSEAPGVAAVHCTIIGFTQDSTVKPQLWDYESLTSEPTPVPVKVGINPYLLDAHNEIVRARATHPLSTEIHAARYGSKPADDGNLIIKDSDAYEAARRDPIASKYIRPYIGASELIRGNQRWCLWLEDAPPADIKQSTFLRERVEANAKFRAGRTPTGDAYKLRLTPSLFRPNPHHPRDGFLCIPAHFSGIRRYMTVDWMPKDTIASNAVFTVDDPTGLAFALISSAMFMAWQDAIGGRLKSDNRFANTLTWNTFPVPILTDDQRASIIMAGQKVRDARAQHPNRTLEDHYAPLTMSPELLKAHRKLDTAVDKAFGAEKMLSRDQDRLKFAFGHYLRLLEKSETSNSKN